MSRRVANRRQPKSRSVIHATSSARDCLKPAGNIIRMIIIKRRQMEKKLKKLAEKYVLFVSLVLVVWVHLSVASDSTPSNSHRPPPCRRTRIFPHIACGTHCRYSREGDSTHRPLKLQGKELKRQQSTHAIRTSETLLLNELDGISYDVGVSCK